MKNELSVKGTNSLGDLLAGEFSKEAAEQQENNGCNIFSIEVTGTTAVVSYETVENYTLVVGIYEEDGVKMLASQRIDVLAKETHAVVEFKPDEIPQYFLIRGFLVDTETLQPLCVSYESPMYTQEFLAKTTDDFDTGQVLNLDEDTTNNFAVYNEETIRISQNEGANQIVSADETNHIYVIGNADENISSLQPDDIFSYEYGENELLIVKVASVQMDGTTATITGIDTSMEEVFDYVKIDGEAGTEDARIDESSCGEGVPCEGLVDNAEENEIESYAIDLGGSKGKSLKHEFNKKIGSGAGSVTVSGGVELKIEFTAKLYISGKEQYMELKLDYSAQLSASVDAVKAVQISSESFNYNGKVQKPSVTVTDSKGVKLNNNTDYTVSYASGCKDAGIYQITVTLKGNYSGSINKLFAIDDKEISSNMFCFSHVRSCPVACCGVFD